jgi:AraC family transcriptional regulator, regulatory protein of adaptative response / methylated-DNA-[protein]-cysteine methyltransferase
MAMGQIEMTSGDRAGLDEEQCWRAILGETDGRNFFYGVLTTGVFCRPDCKARRPRRENVRFFISTQAALRAGLRPCKRCKPTGAAPGVETAARIAAACRRIEDAENTPALADLAEKAGLSPFHFHRLFKAATGLTPKAYATAVKQSRMRDNLAEAGSVTEAIYAAGYSSSSRFYEADGQALGMAPSRYRAGGKDTLIRYAVEPCWLGLALIAATDTGICAMFFGDDADTLAADLRARFPAARIEAGGKLLEAAVRAALRALEEPALAAGLPLDIRGTAFQRRVWEALRAIPPGRTATYTEIAGQLGDPTAVRAVAGACAANPVAVAIPCHRVVRKGGALAGYRWGIERKRRLLERESGVLTLPALVPSKGG